MTASPEIPDIPLLRSQRAKLQLAIPLFIAGLAFWSSWAWYFVLGWFIPNWMEGTFNTLFFGSPITAFVSLICWTMRGKSHLATLAFAMNTPIALALFAKMALR